MMPNKEIGANKAEVLIKALVGEKRRTDLEHREQCFDAVAAVARLMVTNPEDLYFRVPKIGLGWEAARQKAQQTIEHMAERGRALRREGVAVCGLHFIDPSVGRRSRIWVTKDWKTTSPERVSADDHFWTWWAYSDLWLRSYWHVLRTSTTLINAFHEGVLAWDAKPVHIQWRDEDTLATAGALNADAAFVKTTQDLAKEFSGVLAKAVAAELAQIKNVFQSWSIANADETEIRGADEQYASAMDTMLDRVVQRLDQECVLARLREAAIDSRRRILDDPSIRRAFVELLRKLEGREGAPGGDDIASAIEREWASGDPAQRHTGTWQHVLSCVEAVQSAVMNQHSFCSDAGFWLDRFTGPAPVDGRPLELYLILGYSKPPTGDIEPHLQGLRRDVEHLLVAADKLGKITEKPKATSDPTVTNIVSLVNNPPKPALPREELCRWIKIVLELARKAVHERRELNFLVGFGPAYLAQVRARLYEPAPANLVSPNVSPDQIVHFIKSYFSLFGNNDSRLIWFDAGGRFRGVFESPSPVQDDFWLGHWGSVRDGSKEQYLIARIFGRDAFDLLDRELEPILRFMKGKITPPTGTHEIEQAIKKVSEKVFPNDRGLAEAASCFARSLTDHLKRRGHGTSFILVNTVDGVTAKKLKTKDKWRLKLTEQCRSLAPGLLQYKAPIVDLNEFKTLAGNDVKQRATVIDRLVSALAPLADLDGALLLTVGCRTNAGVDSTGDKGLHVFPAQQVVPLIKHPSEGTVPLDFFGRLRRELQEKIQKKETATNLPTTLSVSQDEARLDYDQLLALVGVIQSSLSPGKEAQLPAWTRDLAFLNSAGTRHHSLWGISITATDSLFAVTLSEDGHVRVFWDGREFVGEKL